MQATNPQSTGIHVPPSNGTSHAGALSSAPQLPASAFQGIGEVFRPMIRAALQQELAELPNIFREEIRNAMAAPLAANGVPLLPVATAPRITAAQMSCTKDGCTSPQRAKGLCSAHYQKSRRAAKARSTARAKRGGKARR